MFGNKDTPDVAKKAAEVAQKKEQQLVLGWSIASKPKAQNPRPKQNF